MRTVAPKAKEDSCTKGKRGQSHRRQKRVAPKAKEDSCTEGKRGQSHPRQKRTVAPKALVDREEGMALFYNKARSDSGLVKGGKASDSRACPSEK